MIITTEEFKELKKLASAIADAKKGNKDYELDNNKIADRYLCGLCGEKALEKELGLSIIDWQAEKFGKKFERPDIDCLGIGIKSYKLGSFPLIYRENTYDQIICSVLLEDTYAVVHIRGVATAKVLNKFQDDSKVKDPKVRWKKTAFVGDDYLIPLEKYLNKKKGA